MALPAFVLKAKGALAKAKTANDIRKSLGQSSNEEQEKKLPLGCIVAMPICAIMFLPMFVILLFSNGSSHSLSIMQDVDPNKAYASTGFGSTNYLEWAVSIANDNSHGYSQCNRTGPDYDCSSLVWYSLVNGAGFSEEELGGQPFSTYTEGQILTKVGFKEYSYSSGSLQPGDILLRDGHTGIYVGDGQVVEAIINEYGTICGGSGGDQTGGEISVNQNSGNWSTYYRLEG